MKKLILSLCFLMSLAPLSMTKANAAMLKVVELYTSQGCSSCPPADAFLGELSQRDDVLALGYHVDYWDYIGWRDPYASALFTERQRAYATFFDLRYVYTPQMIVNGQVETSGNRRGQVLDALAAPMHKPEVRFKQQGSDLVLNGGSEGTFDVMWVAYVPQDHTKVLRGENRGRVLTNYHSVLRLEKRGTWTGGEARFSEPDFSDLDQRVQRAIFLQNRATGQILGAFLLSGEKS